MDIHYIHSSLYPPPPYTHKTKELVFFLNVLTEIVPKCASADNQNDSDA